MGAAVNFIPSAEMPLIAMVLEMKRGISEKVKNADEEKKTKRVLVILDAFGIVAIDERRENGDRGGERERGWKR